jgi:two-component system phosphate regulon sensor histidine kinase PhoR
MARYRADIALERRRARIRAERRPRSSGTPALLTNIVNGITDPLILLDRKRKVVHANRAALSLLGENIVGRDIAFYLRHPTALKAIEQAIAEGEPKEQEISLLDPVERDCLLRVNVIKAPDLNEEGEKQSFLILSIYDITKIKLAEKMRVDFVANASHELRTPLASILGFIETLQGPAARDEEARQRFFSIMADEASRMQRLIDDLLSLSRIEMDQHLPPEDSVDIASLLQGLTNTMDLRTGDARGAIELKLPDNLPRVRGDRDQLVQVFQNLIDNAIKYGRPGEPIKIRAECCDSMPTRREPGVAVAVFNQGEGIPAEHIPRLTERFYRVDTARSRKLGGTGLGLAIVKHIINRHRGALNIESEPGIGTTVTVFLPLANGGSDGRPEAASGL